MVKISGLPSDPAPTLTDEVPTRDVETNTTKRALLSSIRDLFFNNIPITSSVGTGWSSLSALPYQVSYNNNRNYTVLWAADLTGQLSAGMRVRFQRGSAAPTQCTSLNGTTQYYSKTSPAGMTFTDDFAVSAWVKLNAYQQGNIVSRYNGTSGWQLRVEANGQISLTGYNAGSANFSQILSFPSVPLNKWVHVAAQLDMSSFTATSSTSYVLINGIEVPAQVSRAGTNPTALIQAGNLEVGSQNGGSAQFFNGKIAQVAIYSAKLSESTFINSLSDSLVGNETSLISAYSFNNSINDLNTINANNLTANASAVATNADSPYAQGAAAGLLEYGIITNISFSGATIAYIQVPEGSALSSVLPVAVSYSSQKIPYGFPDTVEKWQVSSLLRIAATQASPTASTWYNPASYQLNVPIGSWRLGYQISAGNTSTAFVAELFATLSTASTTESDIELTAYAISIIPSGANTLTTHINRSKAISVASPTPYYMNFKSNNSGTIGINVSASSLITAECAYL